VIKIFEHVDVPLKLEVMPRFNVEDVDCVNQLRKN
jgi:isocitrate/isopropylmalate dehydrogenase